MAGFCVEFVLAACMAAAAQEAAPPQDGADALQAAQDAIAAGDWNAALNRLDEARAVHAGEASFWLLYGDTTLKFLEQRLAQGERDAGLVDGLYGDAESAFQRAGELAPDAAAPWLGLARTRRARGDAAGAWEAAAAADARSGGSASPELLMELGHSGLAATIAAVQAGRPVPAAARRAEEALRQALAAGDAAAVTPLSDLLAWRQLHVDARDVLVSALQGRPDHAEWILRLQNLGVADAAAYVADLELVRASAPGDATLLWYLGDAYYRRQQHARAQADFLAAYEALDRGEECFLAAQSSRPEYAPTCHAFLHLVRCARGWTLREEGRVDDAAQTFAAALEADPARLEPDNAPGSLRLGIYTVVDDFFQAGRLAEAQRFLHRVTAVHDANPDWMNNHAFACRELGVARLEQDRAEEAAALFEESWRAYSRAVELAPEDARLINDRALIAIYYLDHDLELAESELQRAVRLGEAQLQALPEDTPIGVRERLEEAVGDAWENRAYLDLVRRGRTDRAEEFLAHSIRYYPYDRRPGVQRLRVALEQQKQAGGAPGSAGNGGC